MSRGPVREEKQTTECIPDISTLLRIGHFYFALTHFCVSCCTTRLEVVIVKKSETGGDAAFSIGEDERC